MAPANARRADPRSSMSPAASRNDLLYISDIGTDDVYAFSYPGGKLLGTLTGFQEPAGLCVDKAGNVWIADAAAAEIFEYAHGGTTPIATLQESGQEPLGCAIDPTTGNLAVSNMATATGGSGSVAVYTNASGTPTDYTDPAMAKMVFLAYDSHGNLFVDGANASSAFAFAELPSGGNALTNVDLNQSFEAAGGVAWDGKYVAVGDALLGVVYQFSITANGATEVGTTNLTDGAWVEQFCIPLKSSRKTPRQGDRIIGPAVAEQHVGYWDYPAGGTATKMITKVDKPLGSVVSRAGT
jgi:DNA-binding beta-propeller fold protein YncE